jgi:GINS complex subunit 3
MSSEDYFSIDDILASEPRVYATFRVRGHLLGHLDPLASSLPDPADKENSAALSNSNTTSDTTATAPPAPRGRDLQAGRRVALPFWLVSSLAERGVVDVDLPRCFGARVRNDLRADPVAAALYPKCRFYYALGLGLAVLLRDGGLAAMLLQAFAGRCWNAVDKAAYGSAVGKGAETMAKLDELERDLFFASHGTVVALRRCKGRTADKIATSRSILGKRSAQAALLSASSPLTPRPRTR